MDGDVPAPPPAAMAGVPGFPYRPPVIIYPEKVVGDPLNVFAPAIVCVPVDNIPGLLALAYPSVKVAPEIVAPLA